MSIWISTVYCYAVFYKLKHRIQRQYRKYKIKRWYIVNGDIWWSKQILVPILYYFCHRYIIIYYKSWLLPYQNENKLLSKSWLMKKLSIFYQFIMNKWQSICLNTENYSGELLAILYEWHHPGEWEVNVQKVKLPDVRIGYKLYREKNIKLHG